EAEALRMMEEAVRQNSEFWLARLNLAELYLAAGRHAEAREEIQQARRLAPDSNLVMATQVVILTAAGEQAGADEVIAEMAQKASREYVSPYYLAVAYAGLGDQEVAIGWLQKAVAEKNPMLVFLGVDSVWDGLRFRPEFEEILQQVNLADNLN
ncbi:MAG TPA: tetratricopeptide repeat protein, partial [Xanthomonadales bacterium]|nr:tetratricopeptide repeat protein [Xanthomonadales bacterium]